MKGLLSILLLLGTFSALASTEVKINLRKEFGNRISCDSDLDAICRAFNKTKAVDHKCKKVWNLNNALQGKHGELAGDQRLPARLRMKTIYKNDTISMIARPVRNGDLFIKKITCI